MAGDGSSDQGAKPKKQKQHKKNKKPNQQQQHEKKEKQEIKKEVKKEVKQLKKKISGPPVKMRERITASLGVVNGNKDNGPNLSLATFLNPGVVKSPDEDKAFGPLQAAAAQYGLWRVKDLIIRLTPLVGPSAVSGTLMRLSFNQEQSPGMTSWGGLGARSHRDVSAGKALTWKVSDKDLAGPRDGGWWTMDMNNEGLQSGGPVLEAHMFGATNSTYKDEPWTAPLWIVELQATWEFSNYTIKPALASLSRLESKEKVTVAATPGSPITVTLAEPSELALWTLSHEPVPAAAEQSVGEVVYQVVDAAAEGLGSAFPPPFNWLARGGWWFMKRLLGRTRTGEQVYEVFASLADAQNNRPALATASPPTTTPVTTTLAVTQLNAPNTGVSTNLPSLAGYGPHNPTGPFTFSAQLENLWAPNGSFQTTTWTRDFQNIRLNTGSHQVVLSSVVHYRVAPGWVASDSTGLLTLEHQQANSWSIQLQNTPDAAWYSVGLVLAHGNFSVGWNMKVILWKATQSFQLAIAGGSGVQNMFRVKPTYLTNQWKFVFEEFQQNFTTAQWPGFAGKDVWYMTVYRGANMTDGANVVDPSDFTFTTTTPNSTLYPLMFGPGAQGAVTNSCQLRLEPVPQQRQVDPALLSAILEQLKLNPDSSDSDDEEDFQPSRDAPRDHTFPPDFTVVSTTADQAKYEQLRQLGASHDAAVTILGYDPTV